jgi:pyruvate dehydrogenase E1 component beta subunit
LRSQELERDPTVMVMGEDVGHYGGSYKARGVAACFVPVRQGDRRARV